MDIRDFLKLNLSLEIDGRRKHIRALKKEIKGLEQLQIEVKTSNEEQMLNLVKSDESLYNQYVELKKEYDDISNKELKNMIATGKIREVLHVDTETTGVTDSNSGNEQPIDGSKPKGRPGRKPRKTKPKSE